MSHPDSFPPDWQDDKIPNSIKLVAQPISKEKALKLEAERNKEQSEKHILRINILLENGSRTYNIPKNTNLGTVAKLIALYTDEGWTVKRTSGSDQRDGDEWDYLAFS